MECMYLPSMRLQRTPIYRQFSLASLISFYMFDDIRTVSTPEPERYDFWQFIYLKEGMAVLTTEDGTEYEVEAGHIIFCPPFRASQIRYHAETKNEVYIISFECSSASMSCFERAPDKLYGEEVVQLMTTISIGIRIFETIRPKDGMFEGLRLKKDVPVSMVNYCASCMELFLNMLYCRFTQAKYYHSEGDKVNQRVQESRLVADVKQYLADNISENPSIEEIAAEFHVNPVTLMKLFKREMSTSIIRYHTIIKIDEAMRLIAQTSMNFTEIANALGFSSVNYFSRVFKNRLGISPTEFARQQSKSRSLIKKD